MPRPPLLPLLAAIGLSAATVPAVPDPAAAAACPAQASEQIEGLYRWLMAQEGSGIPLDLSSQRQRFTSSLHSRLSRAMALQPGDGPFLDFDVFSGTQVGILGTKVQDCRPLAGGALEARVAVRVGISTRRPEKTPEILRYQLLPAAGGGWQIADITYSWESDMRLSTVLTELLDGKP